MAQNTGLVERERHSSAGNGALLVVVNSGGRYWERAIVDETILVALEHFGMPYRMLDLAEVRLSREVLDGCAAIVLAQNQLGARLTGPESRTIAAAVRRGVGLVNLDYDLRLYKAPLLEIFGFENINPHPYTTTSVRVRETDHYITAMQAPGEFHTFDRMVTATIAGRWRDDVVPLADGILGRDQLIYIRHLAPWSAFEPGNYPILFATRWGKGKAVQFTLNQRVWRNAFFGHARDMDDLFWRSILWAVRKPFAANILPPFVTMSVDDCRGRYDFGYADVANGYGYRIMPSLLLELVPERLFPKVREGLASGRVQYNSHALDYYRLMTYSFGKSEYSREELKRIFAYEDAWWKKLGVRPNATVRHHWGEYGVDALPFLKERGYLYFCPALQMGLHKADMCMDDGFWPYNLQNCYYDYVPDDHHFFAFAAFLARHTEDFLTGTTGWARDNDVNDVEKAGANAALQIRHGLRGCFYAEVVTHEQKFDALTLDEWDRILRRAGEMTDGYEKIHASHDEIGGYLKGKDGVWIAGATVDGNRLRCRLAGKTAVPLRLSVFRDVEDGVEREYREVGAFKGRAVTG